MASVVRPCGAYSVVKKVGEGFVGGNDVAVDGVGDLLGQTLLVFRRNACGILFGRQQKRIGIDDALALRRKFFEQEADRHELVFHAGAQDFGGLAQNARNLVKTRDVVFVVLDGIERARKAADRQDRYGCRSAG